MRCTGTRSTTEPPDRMGGFRDMPTRLLLLLATVPLLLASDCYDDRDRALVSFALFPASEQGIEADLVTIRFDDGRSARTVTGEDFSGGPGRLGTREFETRTSGTLTVDVTLADAGGTFAAGEVEIPLRSDWRWGVSLHLGDDNPHDRCFGCFGYESFAIAEAHRDSPADSLWVVWGGNSISDPVVY